MMVLTKNWIKRSLLLGGSILLGLAWSGCGDGADSVATEATPSLTPVRFQMGWFAQPERGGFVEGVAGGHFEAAGLDVTLLNGGPQKSPGNLLAAGEAELGDFRVEEALALIEKGIPLVIVAAYMQHDAQAILVHADGPIHSFEDLAGRKVMMRMGSAFAGMLEHFAGVEFSMIPLTGGGVGFLADKEMARQCFITSEPFYMEREGVPVRTLSLADRGFDLMRVIAAPRAYAESHPEAVSGFLKGMMRGWEAYLEADSVEAAHALMLEMNPQLDPEGMVYSRRVLREAQLISGKEPIPGVGYLDLERLQRIIDQLTEMGFLDGTISAEDAATTVYWDAAVQ